MPDARTKEWNTLSAMTTSPKQAGDLLLRPHYCSHATVNSETMDVLNHYFMWTFLCTTKGLIWICWATKNSQCNPLLVPHHSLTTWLAPAPDEGFCLLLDYKVSDQVEEQGMWDNWISWYISVLGQLFGTIVRAVSLEEFRWIITTIMYNSDLVYTAWWKSNTII